ncbi:MAG TPA: C40 family peptidase [Pedococcus sp.]|nr:C40 family peptidase [Pedococcus sp.]
MPSSFDSFFNAIVGQESGGNFRAVNARTGALGFAQVLPSNVAAWSREVLGYSVTPQQFLNSPQLQMQIVKGKLQQYYNQWGARGAASAWYSGSPNGQSNYHRFNANEPSIGEYVDQVLARMGGDYGSSMPTKFVDNRVQQSTIGDPLQQSQPQPQDALTGVDRSGLGLGAADTPGLEAATGGAGLAAPQTSNPVKDTSAAKDMPYTGGPSPVQNMPYNGSASGQRGAVIDLAKQFVGTPYVWGGAQPGGFDCSGLIQYAMKQAGISVPRVSWDQLAMGQRTDISKLQPGDFIGFGDGGHIALYLGGGQILEAPRTGLDVRVRSLGQGENAWGVSLASLYK